MIIDRAQVAAALPAYELGAKLGAGVFGLVLAGRHRQLQRDVAIKVLSAAQEKAAVGFAGEGRILAGLDHPHVVRVYDYAETDELHLIVMESLSGGTLTSRRVSLPPEGACAVGLVVATALSYAHGKGVLHRDIKPDNMLFDSAGLLKVTDFGIAKLFAGSAVTASANIGTPKYMAPEQITGGRLGPATDLYALGVVLYELLAGAAPFDPTLPVHMLWQHHLTTVPDAPAGVPAPIAEAVLRALAKDPTDRPPSAHAFALDLAAAAADTYGSGWISRSGIILRLDDDVRAVADRPPDTSQQTPPPLAAVTTGSAEPHPRQADSQHAPTPPASDGREPARSGRVGRIRRRQLAVAAALLLLAVTGTVLAVSAARGGNPRGTNAHPSAPATSNPASQTLASPAPSQMPAPSPSLLRVLATEHTSTVTAVVFSPDGRIMATGSEDNTVRLWDVTDPAAPRPLGTPLAAHTDKVWWVVFSPDGHTLASAGVDKTVRLWDVSDPAAPHLFGPPLIEHADRVTEVAFSPDGHTLASASYDKTVRLWDVTDPAAPRSIGKPLTGYNSVVHTVVFSPDGQTLATGSSDQTILLWDVTDRSNPRRVGQPLTGHTGGVSSLVFSRDGRTLASASSDQTVRLWDVTDRLNPHPLGERLTGHTQQVQSVALSPDGRLLASGSFDRTVRLWDVTDLASPRPLEPPLTGHIDKVLSVAFSPDGKILASGSGYDDRTVRLWKLN